MLKKTNEMDSSADKEWEFKDVKKVRGKKRNMVRQKEIEEKWRLFHAKEIERQKMIYSDMIKSFSRF